MEAGWLALPLEARVFNVLKYIIVLTYVPSLLESNKVVIYLQPFGFFNCSPAVDVPPSESAVEEVGIKEAAVKGVEQPDNVQPTLMSKL